MPKEIFHFKNFSVYQPCNDVMKVSTDSVLLGAFADAQNKTTALDIGCGTGLLCLMLAQKNPQLKIIGIDINYNAYQCAQFNTTNSQYSQQINILHISLKNFLDQSKFQFDLIISNPPYFSASLKSPASEKNIYRHQEQLSFSDLIDAISVLLSDNGVFYVVIPYYEIKIFINILQKRQLYIHRQLDVFSNETKKDPYIFLLEIKKNPPHQFNQSRIFIYNNNQKYTDEYLTFTKEFYLFAK